MEKQKQNHIELSFFLLKHSSYDYLWKHFASILTNKKKQTLVITELKEK